MHRRHRFTSVPTEILRSVVSVSEAGSLSKAAKVLGISQPAISAQMKRIEDMVGGAIFAKGANGSAPTELGRLVLVQARKILEANQQILLLRGAANEQRGLRLGISDLYASMALQAVKSAKIDDVSMVVNGTAEIMQGVLNGFIDLGLVLLLPDSSLDPSIEVIGDSPAEMAWARSRDFVISPGAPIPLLTGSGQIGHQLPVDAVERQGLIYRIAFTSPDPAARIEAAKAGIGLTVLPRNQIPNTLVEAREYYLPVLPHARLTLCRRAGSLSSDKHLISLLKESVLERPDAPIHKIAG